MSFVADGAALLRALPDEELVAAGRAYLLKHIDREFSGTKARRGQTDGGDDAEIELVLRTIVGAEDPLRRRAIIARTKLSKQVVTNRLNRLVRAGRIYRSTAIGPGMPFVYGVSQVAADAAVRT